MVTNQDGLVVEWSKGAEGLTGYSRAESIGKPLWDIQLRSAEKERRTAELHERMRSALQAILKTGQPAFMNHSLETAIERPDGLCVPIQTFTFSVPVEEGFVLVSILRDISTRKQAEEALRASEARFRGFFEDAPIALWEEDASGAKQRLDALRAEGITDLRRHLTNHPEVLTECAGLIRIVNVNQAAIRLFGASRKEDLLHTVAELVGGQPLPQLREEFIALAEGKTSFSWEGINKTLSGGVINVSLTFSVAPGYEKTFSKIYVSMIDTTQQQLDQSRIRALAKFPDENPFPVLRVHEKGFLLYANAASARLLEEWHTAVGENVPVDWIRLVQETLADGTKRAMHAAVGQRLWAFEILPVVESGYVNLYGRDVTEQQRAEEGIRRQLGRLAALHQIDQYISSSFDLRLTLTEILGQVRSELGADAADVLVLSSPGMPPEFGGAFGFRTRAAQTGRVRIGETATGYQALTGNLAGIQDLRGPAADVALKAQLAGEDFACYYATTLVAKGKMMGVLELYHRSALAPDQEWWEFQQILAGQAAIAIDNSQLFNGLQRSNVDLTLAYDATIKGWSRAMDLRDRETEGHSERVTEMVLELATLFGIGDQGLVHIRRGALLHDVGKMGIPDGILLNTGSLTPAEWEIMKKHPTLAYEMLSPIAYLMPAMDIPYCHHEKWDGTGYPRGLKGTQIPLAARIFAVVDVWDALTSERPYRPAWSHEQALEYINSQVVGLDCHFHLISLGKHGDRRRRGVNST